MGSIPPIDTLIIEDDADTRANLCDILELDAHRIETAATFAEAVNRSDWEHYAAIILDRRLPDGMADEWLPRLKQLAPEAAILIVTGYLLYYVGNERVRNIISGVHWILGLAIPLAYLLHRIAKHFSLAQARAGK